MKFLNCLCALILLTIFLVVVSALEDQNPPLAEAEDLSIGGNHGENDLETDGSNKVLAIYCVGHGCRRGRRGGWGWGRPRHRPKYRKVRKGWRSIGIHHFHHHHLHLNTGHQNHHGGHGGWGWRQREDHHGGDHYGTSGGGWGGWGWDF